MRKASVIVFVSYGGGEVKLPRIQAGLFEPNRNLIRSTLQRMWEKRFKEK
jgi:hypothetical protein